MSKDNEIYGEGNAYNFGARIYDSRLGRWMAIDPLYKDYPNLSSFIFSANSPIVFKDIDGRKFVNPYSDLLNDAEQKVLKAESIYNDLKANKVSGEELRDAKRNLKDAQSSLASLMIKNNIANDLINTLELSNKREFDYFETLKNPDGKDVNIIVNVENMQGPKISGPNGVSYINANVEANWVVKNNDDDQIDVYAQDETIKIFIYQNTNPQTGSASFIKYADFANELGDIKYVYDVIKNRNDLDVWTNSSGVNDPLYFSKEGAGEYSRQYSKERVKDVNDFINKNSNARLSDNETIKN